MTDFKFTDKSKNVLKSVEEPKEQQKTSKMGRPKSEIPRRNKITCYFSDEEFEEVKAFLDGRPGSSYLRGVILEKVRDNN